MKTFTGVLAAILALSTFTSCVSADPEATAAIDVAKRAIVTNQYMIGRATITGVSKISDGLYDVDFTATYKAAEGDVKHGKLHAMVSLGSGGATITARSD